MTPSAGSTLRRLEQCLFEYGEGTAQKKSALLAALGQESLSRPADLLRLHEALCFLRAYPDDAKLLGRVAAMLAGFERRNGVQRHRRVLADTGLAGTEIHYTFFWPTALWLTRRWGAHLRVDWSAFEGADRLENRLHLLALYAETPGLDEIAYPLREWIGRMKGAQETDAAFLVRRFAALRMPDAVREAYYQELSIPMILEPGRRTPARTRARYPGLLVAYQTGPLDRARPRLPDAIRREPADVRALDVREGRALIALAREAMVTRARDLDAFAYGDSRDVRLIDCGGGLQFGIVGLIPSRRLLLETVYGMLTLKNGVPVGYVLVSALFGSSEVAYNVFDTYRGAEAASIYGWVLAAIHHLFGSDAFTIYPYQLGHGNEEGLRSGAWWFYQKLGFRPQDAEVCRLMEHELHRMTRNRAHRSSIATLKQLAAENMYYFMGKERDDVIGRLPLANVGLAVTRYLAGRFGSDRERGARTCSREAAKVLGARSRRDWTAGERLAWERWSPLVCVLPGIDRWSGDDRAWLVEVIRCKGGVRESEYAQRFDRHRKLRAALKVLAEAETED